MASIARNSACGEGLAAMRGDRVRSIVSGIDTVRWNPETDPALAAHYNARLPDARKVNNRALEQHLPPQLITIEMLATANEAHAVSIERALNVATRHYLKKETIHDA